MIKYWEDTLPYCQQESKTGHSREKGNLWYTDEKIERVKMNEE